MQIYIFIILYNLISTFSISDQFTDAHLNFYTAELKMTCLRPGVWNGACTSA